MNRRQFKDPVSSTCQVSSESRVSEVPGSDLTGGNILLLEFFVFMQLSLDANIVNVV